MAELALYITNKCYSSWSLRAWLVMRAFDIPFDEVMVPLTDDGRVPAMSGISPTSKVPCLVVRDPASDARPVTIWESPAIVEFLAEQFPDRPIWPADSAGRALARSLVAEMHAGFAALRSECPMNLRRPASCHAVSKACRNDVKRIEEIFQQAQLVSGGPFMMGDFSALDAFYAPVYSRLMTYRQSKHPAVLRFGAALAELPALMAWVEAAADETAIITAVEV